MATRTRRRTCIRPIPIDATAPISCGRTRVPRREHHRPRPDVVPLGTHERPGRKRAGHDHRCAVEPAILLDRDGVRAAGDRRTGEDPSRLPGPERRANLAGRDPLGHPQRRLAFVRDVGGPHRVAVHRAVRMTRHIDRRHHVRGDDPAECLFEYDLLALFDTAGAIEQIRARLLHREHGGRTGRPGLGSDAAHRSMVGIPARAIKRQAAIDCFP